MGNNFGKWDHFYSNLVEPDHYINTETYHDGAQFLKDCHVIEDWGCGKGWFRKVFETQYGSRSTIMGIDGSQTPFADRIVDLEKYTTEVPGIFMRHVAEHNFKWATVLQNLIDSFTKRAFVVFYTPMNDGDEAVLLNMSAGWDNIPELSLPQKVWERMLDGISFKSQTIPSMAAYGEETVYLLEK